jgi:hypothetical protein
MVGIIESTGAVNPVWPTAPAGAKPYFAYEVDQLSWKSFTVFM